MALTHKNIKNTPTPSKYWETPKNNLMRYARLNQASPYDDSVPEGVIRTTELQWKAPGKTQNEHYRSVIATAGEFDIPIPGAGTAMDWQNAPGYSPFTNVIVDSTTCAPNAQELEIAWDMRGRNDHLARIAKMVAICEQQSSYDFVPTEQEAIDQSTEKKESIAATLPFRLGQLKALADQVAGGVPILTLWAKGPTAMALGLKKKGIDFPYSKADIEQIAKWMGEEVIAIEPLSGNSSGLLYSIGKLWGAYWNQFLENALKKYDQQVADAPKAGTTIKTIGGSTVYRISRTPGEPVVTGRSEGGRASSIHKRGVDFTKRLRAASKKNLEREAREFHQSSARAREMAIDDSVKQAIAWFLACTEPGKVTRIQLPVGQIEIVCNDVESFDKLNSPEIAAKLHAELAAALGEAPPPPQAEKGSALPWILAAIGLPLGGPIGAGAGFAIGKSLEKK